jgi:hypothetical protein
MFWCGNMTRMGLSGYFANNAIGGISETINCHNGTWAAKTAKLAESFFIDWY